MAQTDTDILIDSPEASASFSSRTNGRTLSVSDLRRPVEDDLKRFRVYFKGALTSRIKLLDHVVRYVLRQKGKQLRPLLVLLSARTCGGMTETTYRGAALVELLHTATLVHDDVVDESDRRRGAYSINALWKNKVGVLLGDFLLSRGLLLALESKDYGLLHVVSDAMRRLSEGEILQLEKARRLNIDEETYFQIISDKTASLIAACTTCGAISVKAEPAAVERMRAFGEKLGLAFQIRDDLFDFGVDDVGKPLGIDIQEKKMTLPLIHALKATSKGERRRIMRIIRKRKKTTEDVANVSRFVEDAGGIAYARSVMIQLAAEASAELDGFEPSDARETLKDLVAFTVTRSR